MAAKSTPPMAASIVTASRCALIICTPTSIANGAFGAAHHAITFLSGLFCSEKNDWGQTSLTLANAVLLKKKNQRPLPAQTLPQRPPRLRNRLRRQIRARLNRRPVVRRRNQQILRPKL